MKEKDSQGEPLFRNTLHRGDLRNKPCICGSGKKVKACHGKDYGITKEQHEAILKIFADKAAKQ